LAREREELAAFDGLTAADADGCVGQAAELRHLFMQDSLLRHQVFELRDALAAKGHEPEQVQFMQQRFSALPPEATRLLKLQTELHLQFQGEAASLEQQRTGATETLRDVDAARAAARTPGWVVLSLGAAALVAGVLVVALRGAPALAAILLVLGVVLAASGAGVLMVGARARQDDRDHALSALAEAQGRINALHRRRAENEAALGERARTRGHRGRVALRRQWNDYARVLEDSGPLLRAQDQLEAAERRRQQVADGARPWLQRIGDPPLTPELLDEFAHGIRRSLGARQRLDDLERGFGWVEDEKRVLEKTADTMRERAVRLLQVAGVPYEPARGWPHHVNALKKRLEGRVRHNMIVEELVPAARRRLHAEHEVAQRRRQLEMLLAGGDLPAKARPSPEIELEWKQTRSKLEEAQRRRSDARVEVEEVWRRHAQKRPDLEQARDRLDRALERARRFQAAVELARDTIARIAKDTHRKWADFLNDRVAEILRAFGTSVDSVRFGEDLEVSVQLDGRPLIPPR